VLRVPCLEPQSGDELQRGAELRVRSIDLAVPDAPGEFGLVTNVQGSEDCLVSGLRGRPLSQFPLQSSRLSPGRDLARRGSR
jgi:hypothetical protein